MSCKQVYGFQASLTIKQREIIMKVGKIMDYVWYASYGSNINTDRFLCYIKGGKPEGSSKVETGCKDPSLPIASSTFTMNFPLYFAKEAAKWESKGVAFIGLTPA